MRKKCSDGFYTVEATFLIWIILVLLQGTIFLMLTYHDRSAVYQTAQRYLSEYGQAMFLTEAERKAAESAFLEEAADVSLYIRTERASFERQALCNAIVYRIGGEERTVRAGIRPDPLVFLRAVRGLTGGKT